MVFKLVISGLLAFSATTASAAPATVTMDINLRSGPGSGYAVMGSFRAGTVVDVQECAGRWCAITYGDVRGYVNSTHLAAVVDPGTSRPNAGLIQLGAYHLGSLVGLDFGTIGPDRSYEGGYYPPRRRLFPPDDAPASAPEPKSGFWPLSGALVPAASPERGASVSGPQYAPRQPAPPPVRRTAKAAPKTTPPGACPIAPATSGKRDRIPEAEPTDGY
jgi:hypothetical protein